MLPLPSCNGNVSRLLSSARLSLLTTVISLVASHRAQIPLSQVVWPRRRPAGLRRFRRRLAATPRPPPRHQALRRLPCRANRRSRAPRTSTLPPLVASTMAVPRSPPEPSAISPSPSHRRRWTRRCSHQDACCFLHHVARRSHPLHASALPPLVALAMARQPSTVRAIPPSPGHPRQRMGECSRRRDHRQRYL